MMILHSNFAVRVLRFSALFSFMFLPFWISSAESQNCMDYSQTPFWVKSVPYGNSHYFNQFVADDRIYILGEGLIEVFDINDLTQPESIATFCNRTSRNCGKIGDLLYVCHYPNTVSVWDVANVDDIFEVATHSLGLLDLATFGDLILGCGYDGNFKIINVNDPTSPILLADLDVDLGELRDVIVHDGLVWVAGFYGVVAIDISDPSSPTILSSISTNYTGQLAAQDGTLVVTRNPGQYSYLAFYNISDPANPMFLSSLSSSGLFSNSGISIEDNRVYLAKSRFFGIIDISDLLNPSVLRYCEVGNWAHSVYHSNGYLVVGMERGMEIFDVHEVKKLEVDGHFPGAAVATVFSPSGEIVCLTGGSYETVFLNINDLGRPWEIGSYLTDGFCYDASLNDSLAVLTDNNGGFSILKYGLDGVFKLGEVNAGYGRCRAIEMEGEKVYLAHEEGISVFDITNFESPLLLGTYFGDDPFRFYGYDDLVVRGEFVLTSGDGQFDVIDFSFPEAPVLVSTSLLGDGNFFMEGEHVFVSRNHSMLILDLSDYSNPVEISSVEFQGSPSNLTILNDVAYVVGHGSFNLQAVDISDLNNPFTFGSLDNGGSHQNIATHEGRLFISDGYNGFSYAFPHCAEESVGLYDQFKLTSYPGKAEITWQSPSGLDASNFILVGSSPLGEWEIPISNDEFGLQAVDQSWNLAHGGSVTYMLYLRESGFEGLFLASKSITVEIPDAPIIFPPPYPNPFNPSIKVDFALDVPRDIKVSIFDLRGRRVALLAQGKFEAGLHALSWDGMGTHGAAAAGMYLVCISSGELMLSRKITLVR